MSSSYSVSNAAHRYQEGLHHHSVSTCPDCLEPTTECEVEMKWYDPADIVVRPARTCSCYRGLWQRLKEWLL